jgi:effector-binding domain-containing protein
MSPETELQISIGKFSQITSLSQRALRIYDEKGFLVPKRDRFNNYRYYTTDQIETGLKVKTLSWMGFSCAEVEEILACLDNPGKHEARIEALFKKRLAETQIEIQKLKKVEEVLQGKKALEVLYMTSTEPVIKEIPDVRVISKHGKGAPGEVVPRLIGEVAQQIFSPANQRGNVNIAGPIMLLYEDWMLTHVPGEVVDISQMEFEVAIPIVGRISVEPGFEVKTIPAGKVLSVIYTGPYPEVGGAYNRALEYGGARGLRINGRCRELYLNDPQTVPENDLMTEIQIPVE